MAKYIGSVFTLLMTGGSFAMGVWFALNGHNGGAFCMAAMCAISGFVVVKNDWPKTWKPLLGL